MSWLRRAARMAQQMPGRWPGLRYMGLEVDATYSTHATCKTRQRVICGFVAAGAQDILWRWRI